MCPSQHQGNLSQCHCYSLPACPGTLCQLPSPAHHCHPSALARKVPQGFAHRLQGCGWGAALPPTAPWPSPGSRLAPTSQWCVGPSPGVRDRCPRGGGEGFSECLWLAMAAESPLIPPTRTWVVGMQESPSAPPLALAPKPGLRRGKRGGSSARNGMSSTKGTGGGPFPLSPSTWRAGSAASPPYPVPLAVPPQPKGRGWTSRLLPQHFSQPLGHREGCEDTGWKGKELSLLLTGRQKRIPQWQVTVGQSCRESKVIKGTSDSVPGQTGLHRG